VALIPKHGSLVVAAVAVGVLEDHDAVAELGVPQPELGAGPGVILDDPEPAALVGRDRDRVLHVGLGGEHSQWKPGGSFALATTSAGDIGEVCDFSVLGGAGNSSPAAVAARSDRISDAASGRQTAIGAKWGMAGARARSKAGINSGHYGQRRPAVHLIGSVSFESNLRSDPLELEVGSRISWSYG